MADTKISALPAATTPLTGTEVLPIVQSGATDKVAVSDLTAGRSVAAATLTLTANSASAALDITQSGAGQAITTTGGRVAIGGSGSAATQVNVLGTLVSSSNVSRGFSVTGTAPTTSTTEITGFLSALSTADGIAAVTQINGFFVSQGTITGGTRVAPTTQIGFGASSTLTGATNNYGFYGNIASGTGRWNFFANGTANNAFNGSTRFGGITAPTSTVDVTGSIAATTTIRSSGATSGVGYATGAGGAVTQATSRTTGVTLNNVCGAITLVSAAGSTTWATFTVTNSAVAATDTIIVNQKSGTDLYEIHVTAVAAGSFNLSFRTTGGTTTEQPVFNFAVIKAVAA